MESPRGLFPKNCHKDYIALKKCSVQGKACVRAHEYVSACASAEPSRRAIIHPGGSMALIGGQNGGRSAACLS